MHNTIITVLKRLSACVSMLSIAIAGFGQRTQNLPSTATLTNKRDQTIFGNIGSSSTVAFDSASLNRFYSHFPLLKTYSPRIRDFYRKRQYSFAWFQQGILAEQAGNLSNRMMNLQNDRVFKQIPYQTALDSLLYGYALNKKTKLPDVMLELMLTSQYFIFSQLAWQGMNTAESKSAEWYLPRKKVSYDRYLDSLLKYPAENVQPDEPVFRQYELLITYLRKYRLLSAHNDWHPKNLSLRSFPGKGRIGLSI